MISSPSPSLEQCYVVPDNHNRRAANARNPSTGSFATSAAPALTAPPMHGKEDIGSDAAAEEVAGTTVDRQCGSSLQAVNFAAQEIMTGAGEVAVARAA